MYDEDALLDALAVIIKKASTYSDANVTINDYQVLDKGVDTAAVLGAGPFDSEPPLDNFVYFQSGTEYRFVVEVFHRYTYDAETASALRDDVQTVRTLIDSYHRLDGNAEFCRTAKGARPKPVFDSEGGGPYFMMRELTVLVKKTETMTPAE